VLGRRVTPDALQSPARSPRWSAGFLLVGLWVSLAASPVTAHSASRGQSRWVVDAQGAVAITIDVREDDVLDLFDIDISHDDERPALTARLSKTLPRLLKLSGDGQGCELVDIGWARRGQRTIQLKASARCAPEVRRLVIDWGLSSHGSLDLVSYAQVLAPGDIEHVAVFSRKDNRHAFEVGRPPASEVLARRAPRGARDAIGGALLLVACLVLTGGGRRVLVGGGFVAGVICGGLALMLVPPAARPAALGPALVGLAGLGVAWGPVGLEKRPALARLVKHVLAALGGLGAALAVLTVPELGADGKATAVLARALGAALPMGAALLVLLLGRRVLDAAAEQRQLISAALGGAAALVSIALLLW
jgi:hypothetical protein